MNKICAVYKITNTITGDFYIGSSKDVKERWRNHKKPSKWRQYSNNPMYQDMQKYGTKVFVFEILAEVEVEKLKEVEQQFIEALKPTYNNYNAKGLDAERYKEYQKEYQKEYRKSNKEKISKQKKQYYESNKEQISKQMKQYYESNKEQKKQYYESHKEQKKQYQKEYKNQLCLFNGETLTLNALSGRFKRMGIEHPTQEAKKYLLKEKQQQ